MSLRPLPQSGESTSSHSLFLGVSLAILWTPWKKVADKGAWYQGHALRLPVVFEFGIGAPSADGAVEPVYASTTPSEFALIGECEEEALSISPRLRTELNKGLEVYYRCIGAPNAERRQELLTEVLAARPHPWND